MPEPCGKNSQAAYKDNAANAISGSSHFSHAGKNFMRRPGLGG